MITHQTTIRPRYDEVDQMGYVYHANYVCYFHQARTELLRSLGINDKVLEQNNILLPVIETHIKHKKPGRYDEPLVITTKIESMPTSRLMFAFEIVNNKNELVCTGKSIVVFADKQTRKPMVVPNIVKSALLKHFEFQPL